MGESSSRPVLGSLESLAVAWMDGGSPDAQPSGLEGAGSA